MGGGGKTTGSTLVLGVLELRIGTGFSLENHWISGTYISYYIYNNDV